MSVSWKLKYIDIRDKLKSSTDVAYRLGFEAGLKQGQQAAQMQMQQQMAAAAQQQAMMGGNGQDPSMQGDAGGQQMSPEDQAMMAEQGGQMPPEEEMDQEGGSDLDQHINELQSLVSKGQKPSVLDLRKAVDALAGLRKTQKDSWAKKAQKSTSEQKKFVDSLLKKWEKEAVKPSEGLEDLISQHGFKIED